MSNKEQIIQSTIGQMVFQIAQLQVDLAAAQSKIQQLESQNFGEVNESDLTFAGDD